MSVAIMCFGVVWAVVASVASSASCPSTEISFVRKQGTCNEYEMGDVSHSTPITKDPYRINYFADNFTPFCTAKICGDGRHHLFCTTSGTSDGECIPGNAVENFRNIYGDRVTSVDVKLDTLLVVPALVKELYDGFTTQDRSIMLYEHGNHKGESLEINTKVGQCNNLPLQWQMRVSSYGAQNLARFYTGENCTGDSYSACRDFGKNDFWAKSSNLWGLLCTIDGLNDNTKSFKFE